MADMPKDFVTLVAENKRLESVIEDHKINNNEQARQITDLERKVADLLTMRNDLQRANSDYLERARVNRANDQTVIDKLTGDVQFWQHHSTQWAKHYAEYRQAAERWIYDMRGFGRVGLLLDVLMALMTFATLFGFVDPVFDLRWW